MTDIVDTVDPLSQPDAKRAPAGQIAFVFGTIALSGCMVAALLLVLAHLDAVDLPGCGTASDCTRAAEGRWGRLPGTEWPLSFVGFTYFQAILAAFIYSGRRLSAMLRAVVGMGAVVSLLLMVVMFVEGYLCGYCLAIHVLNIAFVIGYEFSRGLWGRPAPASSIDLVTIVIFAATLVATSLLLGVVDRRITRTAQHARKEQLQQALGRAAVGADTDSSGKSEFGPGRYDLGPQTAPVHVVVVSDYQCPSCLKIDAQLRAAVAGRNEFSISARHFLFCTDCNPHIDKTRHPNACRAALAAEAAGTVGGADAFWQMHEWLFQHRGIFTDDELRRFVREVGLDELAFFAAMQDEKTLALVCADAAAADAAGLQYTPMIFINGRAIDIGQ